MLVRIDLDEVIIDRQLLKFLGSLFYEVLDIYMGRSKHQIFLGLFVKHAVRPLTGFFQRNQISLVPVVSMGGLVLRRDHAVVMRQDLGRVQVSLALIRRFDRRHLGIFHLAPCIGGQVCF